MDKPKDNPNVVKMSDAGDSGNDQARFYLSQKLYDEKQASNTGIAVIVLIVIGLAWWLLH